MERRFEFHIFITSVPRGCQPIEVKVSAKNDVAFWGRHTEESGVSKEKGPFTEAQLYAKMKCPTADLEKLGDIYIHKGRPKWRAEFKRIEGYHAKDTVGIAFCGNHHIAKDLQRYSAIFSDVENNQLFRLHLENF